MAVQLPASHPHPAFPGTPRETEAGEWCWDLGRGVGQATISFWADALVVGAGVAGDRTLLPNLRLSPPATIARRSRLSLLVSHPLVLSFAFLPTLFVCLLPGSEVPPSLLSLWCLSLHLRLHFFLCLSL